MYEIKKHPPSITESVVIDAIAVTLGGLFWRLAAVYKSGCFLLGGYAI